MMPESCEGTSKALTTFRTNPLTEIDLLYHDLKDRTGTLGCVSVRRGAGWVISRSVSRYLSSPNGPPPNGPHVQGSTIRTSPGYCSGLA